MKSTSIKFHLCPPSTPRPAPASLPSQNVIGAISQSFTALRVMENWHFVISHKWFCIIGLLASFHVINDMHGYNQIDTRTDGQANFPLSQATGRSMSHSDRWYITGKKYGIFFISWNILYFVGHVGHFPIWFTFLQANITLGELFHTQ